MSGAIDIRPASKADIPFLTNSWLKSYRDAGAVAGVPNRIYYRHHHLILDGLLPDCADAGGLWVACQAGRDDQIAGWICAFPYADTLCVHYAYVKRPLRRFGVARQLFRHLRDRFPDTPVTYTHKPPIFWSKPAPGERSFYQMTRDEGFVYHPYLLHAERPLT